MDLLELINLAMATGPEAVGTVIHATKSKNNDYKITKVDDVEVKEA